MLTHETPVVISKAVKEVPRTGPALQQIAEAERGPWLDSPGKLVLR